ncbi:MAG: bifunctional LLM class flavin-dependent oxidoreductase/SDR family oxidoreductase, partial [Acidobacteriota bacterium]
DDEQKEAENLKQLVQRIERDHRANPVNHHKQQHHHGNQHQKNDVETAHRLAKKPFCDYLKASMPLLAGLAFSRGEDVDINSLSESELDDFVEFLYERFSTTRALIGTPETCRPLLAALATAGVNEIACLLDFGPATDHVLEHLPRLAAMANEGVAALTGARRNIEQIRRRCATSVPLEDFYSALGAAGVEFDASLHAIRSLTTGEREALTEIDGDANDVVLLDACVQTALAAFLRDGEQSIPIPTHIERIEVHGRPSGRVWAHATVSKSAGSVSLFDDEGNLLIEVEGLQVKSISRPASANDDWFYELAWRETASAPAVASISRPWIVLEDQTGVARAWAARRRGVAHLFLQASARTERTGPAQWSVHPQTGFESLLRAVDLGAYEGILCLWPLDAAANDALDAVRLESDQQLGIEPVIALLRAFTATNVRNVPPLWIATRGAQAVEQGSAVSVSQSTLWGLAGAIAREHRASWGGIIDLDPLASAEQSALDLDTALSSGDGEDQIAMRAGRRFVRRLARSSIPAGEVSFREDGAYLITGGAGGLGRLVAKWMTDRGARHLIALGRAPHSEFLSNAVYSSVDIAEEAQLKRFLEQRTGPPIRGVVHAAGVFHDESLGQLDRAALWDVLRSKVLGVWALHRALADTPLDFFVSFSSFSGITPPAGQAAYAAASAFLDAVAHARRSSGRAALSIDWGAWSEVGFAATPIGRDAHARLEALGMRRLTPAEGLAAFGRLMSKPNLPAQVAVFPANLQKMAASDPVIEHRPLLRDLIAERAGIVPQASEALLHIRCLDAPSQKSFLEEHVGRVVCEVLKIPASRLDVRTPLTQLGLDSLIAVQVKNRLEKEVGLSVPLASALRGSSVMGMVEELMIELRLHSVRAESSVAAHQELDL